MPLVLRKRPFDGDDWHFEVKMDGFRALAYIARDGVTFVSRRNHVFTQFDPLRLALRREINVLACVLDGEIVCLDDQGKPCFLDLMRRVGHPVFVAFDVLMVNAEDLRSLPLWQRKQRLRKLVPKRATSILYADFVRGQGIALYQEAVRRDLEGIVAKRRDSPYDPAQPWIKVKNPDYSQRAGRHELFERRR